LVWTPTKPPACGSVDDCETQPPPRGVPTQVGLWMIVKACQERNYLRANDIYLALAIGNAAWPIGVTQVRQRRARARGREGGRGGGAPPTEQMRVWRAGARV
jgi:hypothetical protein